MLKEGERKMHSTQPNQPNQKEKIMRVAVFIGMMTLAFEAHAGRGGAMLMKDLTRLFSHLFHQWVG